MHRITTRDAPDATDSVPRSPEQFLLADCQQHARAFRRGVAPEPAHEPPPPASKASWRPISDSDGAQQTENIASDAITRARPAHR